MRKGTRGHGLGLAVGSATSDRPSRARPAGPVLVADAYGAPVLRDQDRSQRYTLGTRPTGGQGSMTGTSGHDGLQRIAGHRGNAAASRQHFGRWAGVRVSHPHHRSRSLTYSFAYRDHHRAAVLAGDRGPSSTSDGAAREQTNGPGVGGVAGAVRLPPTLGGA